MQRIWDQGNLAHLANMLLVVVYPSTFLRGQWLPTISHMKSIKAVILPPKIPYCAPVLMISPHILVGGFEHVIFLEYIGTIIIPTDFHIFQRGGLTTR